MAAYLSWRVKILVTNVIEPIKRSESKKLAGNVFACSANKLAFIGWLYSTRPISNMAMLVSKYIGGGEELFGIQLYLALAQNPTQKYE